MTFSFTILKCVKYVSLVRVSYLRLRHKWLWINHGAGIIFCSLNFHFNKLLIMNAALGLLWAARACVTKPLALNRIIGHHSNALSQLLRWTKEQLTSTWIIRKDGNNSLIKVNCKAWSFQRIYISGISTSPAIKMLIKASTLVWRQKRVGIKS